VITNFYGILSNKGIDSGVLQTVLTPKVST